MFKTRLIIRVYDGPDNVIWENKTKGDLGGRIFQACPVSEFIWHSAVLENGRLSQALRNFLNYEKRALGTGETADKAGLRK